MQITCTIIARDEADRIGRAIRSVTGIADEVLVVDSGSTDATMAVSEALGARVLVNPWVGFGPQKRFAEDEAGHDWILNLDADEWLTDELRREILAIKTAGAPATRAFRMRTRIVYPRRKAPHPFADFHNYIRLYNRGITRCRNSLAHDEVLPTDDVVRLRGEILHQSFRSVSHIVQKMLHYSELQRQEGLCPEPVPLARCVLEFPFQFLKYYLLRGHVFGGRAGYTYATAFAFSRWMRLMVRAGW